MTVIYGIYGFNVKVLGVVKVHESLMILCSLLGLKEAFKFHGAKFLILMMPLGMMLVISLFNYPVLSVLRDFLQVLYLFSFYFFRTVARKHSLFLNVFYIVLIFSPFVLYFGVKYDVDRWSSISYFTQVMYNYRLVIYGYLVYACWLLISKGMFFPSKAVFPLFLIFLFYSFLVIRTRGLILASAGSIFYFYIAYRNIKSNLFILLLFIVSIASISIIGFSHLMDNERFTSILYVIMNLNIETNSLDYTMQLRIMFWEEAWNKIDTFNDWLLGVGFGAFLMLDPWGIGQWEPLPASMIHNQLLSLLYNGGIVLLITIIIVFKSIIINAKEPKLIKAFLFGMLLYAFFTPVLSDSVYACIFYYLLAVFSEKG